jgi:hypothetical protein
MGHNVSPNEEDRLPIARNARNGFRSKCMYGAQKPGTVQQNQPVDFSHSLDSIKDERGLTLSGSILMHRGLLRLP